MATRIVMEALSPTMEEGRLVEWKKREGEKVDVGEVLAEVETDKAVMELVARASGTLLKQLVPAGATVPVSQPVGWIGSPGESVDGRADRRADGRTARGADRADRTSPTSPTSPPHTARRPSQGLPPRPAHGRGTGRRSLDRKWERSGRAHHQA